MKTLHKVIMLGALACAAASCESPGTRTTQGPQMRPATITGARRIANVRTTAYTHTERGGRKNAIGARLAGANVMRAAADWSRFPLGARVQIVGSAGRFLVCDFRGGVVGAETIHLF